MLGPVKRRDERLFYCGFSLEDRVPEDHPLRAVHRVVDFSFVRHEVADLYGDRGHESIDPIVVLKLLFLKYFYQVKSARGVVRELPMRLDWLWFCEFDLDDEIPNHSIMSKAKRRWGKDIFVRFFQRVLTNCVQAGLVDGEVVHVDGCVMIADASWDSIKARIDHISEAVFDDDDQEEEKDDESHSGDSPSVSDQRISRTDPEASITKKNGRSTLGYKDHRVVDDRCGVVTATITTPANVDESHVLDEALQQHEAGTGRKVGTVVADKQYGTAANYRMLHEREVTPCIPHKRVRENPTKFARHLFVYDSENDHFTCPAGHHLTRRFRSDGNRYRYAVGKRVCDACPMRSDCTENKSQGRTISRQVDQEMIDWADDCLSSSQRKRLMARRKAKAEGSFADAANNHGYKRMRWRGLDNATVQNLLIGTIQNIRKLIKPSRRSVPAQSNEMSVPLVTVKSNDALSDPIVKTRTSVQGLLLKRLVMKMVSMHQYSLARLILTPING